MTVSRSQADKLIKRDKVNSVLTRLKKNPGPKQTWKGAKNILGRGRGANKLKKITINSDPIDKADIQNKFFVGKNCKAC